MAGLRIASSIDERPDVVERRNRISDWEGDTVNRKRADLLAEEPIKAMAEMKEKVKMITFDNGLGFSAHESIAEGLESDIYFAHSYA